MNKVKIMVKHVGMVRKGRGFSRKEIEESGLTYPQFCALSLPWDPRRRSSHKENVDVLKKLEKPVLKAAKPKTGSNKPAAKAEHKKQ